MDAYALAELMLDVTDCESSEFYQAGVMLKTLADRLKVMEEQVKNLESQVYGGTTK